MEWTSEFFAENVCNLLTKSAVRTIQCSFSSSSWSSAAAWAIEKRSCYTVVFPNEHEKRLHDDLKTDPSSRVTSLVFDIQHESAELEQELGEFLRFMAYDDDSEIDFKVPALVRSRKTAKMTVTKAMNLIESPRFRPSCFFTKIRNLQRVCFASVSFLQRHIKRGILKEVSLMQGWSCKDICWIQDLLPQKQLIKFNSLPSIGVTFELHILNKILATIAAERPPEGNTRIYEFRASFGHRLQSVMETAGFLTKRNYQSNSCFFSCKNICVNVYHDGKSTFQLFATYLT